MGVWKIANQESQLYKFCLQWYSHKKFVETSRNIFILCFLLEFITGQFCPLLHGRPYGKGN